ncbi:class I SAM-dependent methyltransferase [uncultured Jatrophihabitans sp.]|uniref:class I SAM-dependent methyltransferase n=1 Tax=uncultured Jatrophihabitans sp. TaxID=1610747 RepID=UPI0035CA5575
MTIDRLKLDETVPGWLPEVDYMFFEWFLRDQEERDVRGDLVELGVYLGKSAIVIGDHLRDGETLTVVDLFEDDAGDDSNRTENVESYTGLTQEAFEGYYRMFHRDLPVVHRGFSSEIRRLVADDSVRFCHVDASHLYEHVRTDAASAKALLIGDGIVVFDDYRSPHTPGVAAAVWEAAISDGMHPLVLTSQKLYGTWADPGPLLDRLRSSIRREFEVQQILGRDVIRVPSEPPRVVARPGKLTVLAKSLTPQAVKPALRTVRREIRRRRQTH